MMKILGNKTRLVLVVLIIASSMKFINAQETSDYNLAQSYFHEFDSICSIDNGMLWGKSLNGPIMLVNTKNREIIANQPDSNNILISKEGLFIGTLPEAISFANTSIEWSGTNWAMIMWDALSPNNKYARNSLLIHESWHRIQKEIGINPVLTANSHLDELQGAILLKLEFIALKNALSAEQIEVKKANLKNALTIRKYRQLIFSNNNENDFELSEGMAEYTGFKLCGLDSDKVLFVIARQLEFAMNKDGLANSFAYLTGPAYGFIFDEMETGWIEKVHQGKNLFEIGSVICDAGIIQADTALLKKEISDIIATYKAGPFIKSETEKFEKEKELILAYRVKLLNGDQLIIPNNNLSFSFNPNEKLIPLDDSGVVYKTMRITGEWGILEAHNGILRANNWQTFTVSAPATSTSGKITEPDYTLTLNDGWKVSKVKDGKYALTK